MLKELLTEAEDIFISEMFTLFTECNLRLSVSEITEFLKVMEKYIHTSGLDNKEILVLSQYCIDSGQHLVAPQAVKNVTNTKSLYNAYTKDKLEGVASMYALLSQKLTELATGQKPVDNIQLNTDGSIASLNNVNWHEQKSNGYTYHSCKAQTLYRATEILRSLSFVPQNTYYVVDTPDGSLGRDIFGFYTEALIKSSGISLETNSQKTTPVETRSLTAFGDAIKSQGSVASLKSMGQYASFILQMECGHCGYKSPVETKEGSFERECYACGAVNKIQRGKINVSTQSGFVAI
jgi:hypothetical protein